MRILIAEDEPTSRLVLQRTLERLGHEAVVCEDGTQAWNRIQEPDAPGMAILDWMMPGIDGVEICRRARQSDALRGLYLLLLTTRDSEEDIVAGLDAGADDYVTKPPRPQELAARIGVGVRVVDLRTQLAQRVVELEEALSKVKTLQGLLPICSYCKKIRDDDNYWQQVEGYIGAHADVAFSHGICPDCYLTIVEPQLAELEAEMDEKTRKETDR
jgi:sigma-B regulation protein RsbU (phosphoserine phosphatase)